MKKVLLATSSRTALLILSITVLFPDVIPSHCAAGASAAPVTASGILRPAAAASLGRLPVMFQPNRGQAGRSVEFLARGPGYALLLQRDCIRVRLHNPSRAPAELSMKLTGVGRLPPVRGERLLPGATNYFLGDNPARWRTGLPNYARARYPGVYPGIDLILYGEQGRLEYDFAVEPGADPSAIGLEFGGAEAVELGGEGDLLLRVAGGELRQHKPVAYQLRGERREFVESRFRLAGRRVSFEVGEFDRSRTLYIDPVLSYSTFLGGSQSDAGNAIAVDAAGNAYVTGATQWTALATTPGAPQASNRGSFDVFVIKLNPAGNALVYATYLGGSGSDSGAGIAVDAAGNAYVTGRTSSFGFPTTPGALRTSAAGSDDAFVVKLNPSGTALVYSTYLGGSGADFATSVAVNAAGEAYVTGATASSNFPLAGPIQADYRGGTGMLSSDVFVSRLNAAGSALVYSTYLGDTGNDQANGIAVDAAGNAYIAGWTSSSGFPTTPGAYQTSGSSFDDPFVAKINPAGSALVYSTFLNGDFTSEASGIAVDPAGHAYVTGWTHSTSFPTTPGAFQTTFPQNASRVGFVTKMAPGGNGLVYSTLLGGRDSTEGTAIAVDASGNALVAGHTDASDFPLVTPIQSTVSPAVSGFVAKLDGSGSSLGFSTYLGPSGLTYAESIAVDPSGNAYVTGDTGADDFPTANAYQALNGGGLNDAFILKIDFALTPRISVEGITNAASFLAGPVAPGEIISIFGTDLGPTSGVGGGLNAQGRLETTVAGTQVFFDGIAAPLFYVRNDQINLEVPYSVAGKQTVQVQVSSQNVLSNTVTVPVAATAPGIFAYSGGKDQAVMLNEDGSFNSPSEPAKPGTVVVFWATGEGQTNPPGVDGKLATPPYPAPVAPLSITIGGLPVGTPDFAAAAPGFTGLMQINARVPQGVQPGKAVPVVLTIGGRDSQPGLTMVVGSEFVISNVRAIGTAVSQGAKLAITLDFVDPSGGATTGTQHVNFDINNGDLKGFFTASPEGVQPGQTSGTMTLSFTFPGSWRPAQNLPIVVSIVNSLGLESNEVVGTFSVQ
jgi:uncharacterized protein (TIGR03437 family)